MLGDVTAAKPVVQLRGAGASFPGAVYQAWLINYKAYRQDYVTVSMKYEAVGSGAGQSRIIGDNPDASPLEYAGSDSLLSRSDYLRHPDLQMFPTMAG